MALQSRLPTINKRIRQAVRDALEESANDVANTARALAPIDPRDPAPGALKASIRTHVRRREAEVTAGDEVAYYARFVEHGTRHASAHPFLVPAAEMHREAVVRKMVAAIRGACE